MSKTGLRVHVVVSSFAALTLGESLHAQSVEADQTLSEIVVTGSRGEPRTVQESPVPIDVIGQAELERVPASDTVEILKALVPSYAVTRQPNSTTGTFIRPISLRGLPEDKVLLLLNSKRRHKSASVGITGTGAQGPDAAVIPASALKSVEVLRDGAAALYGSDAIAGVLNFILKDDREGMSFTTQGGQYFQGDGTDLLVAGNIGLPLTDHGFINISAEYSNSERTIRADQYTSVTFDAVDYAATHPEYAALVDLSTPLQRWGQPKSDAVRAVINSGIEIAENAEWYAFANYSNSKATADANYRYPANNQPVNGVPVRLADGSVFTFTDLFPAGFTPQFSGEVTDYSGTTGLRGEFGASELKYDFSARYGRDELAYTIVNTVNPSIGPESPRSFAPSEFVADELSLNADFSYELPIGWFASPLVAAAGVEYRDEGYEIHAGDLDSYRAGIYATSDPYDFCNPNGTPTAAGSAVNGLDCANPQDPVYRVLSVGSNGITGVPPSAAGSWNVRSNSVYTELTTDIVDGWFVDLAGRYEDFSSFGSTLNGKLATRVQLMKGFAIRGSVGTGFHAPSPGLLNTTSVSIRTVDGVFTQAGLFPASNPVSVFLGAKPLEPEEATNFSAGITANPLPNLDITVDAYVIKLKDQIYSTSAITVTPAIRAAMIAAGVVGADSISSVNFFQNAFDSTTKGVDVVSTYRQRWNNGQATAFTASFNYNRYEIDRLQIANLFNDVSIFNFENQPPQWRGVLSVTHDVGPLSASVRANMYGPYEIQLNQAPTFPKQAFHTETLVDVEVSYELNETCRLTLGGRNIFDNFPQHDLLAATAGRVYRADSVVDWQGGFYYARVGFSFD